MKLRLALLCLLASIPAFGQVAVSRYDNFVWTVQMITGMPVIKPIPYVTIAVCSYPATGLPCSNTATLYTDSTGTTACNGGNGCSNPMQSGSDGTFGFWVPAGHYQYTVSLGSVNFGTFDITIGSGTGGGTIPGLASDGNNGITITNSLAYGGAASETKNASGSVSANTIVKLNAAGQVLTTNTSDTGALGIATASVTTGNPVTVAVHGIATCIADNTVTSGNLVGIGATTSGRCLDLGTSAITAVSYSVGVMGRAVSSATAGNTFTLELYGPYTHGAQAPSSGGGISGLTTGVIPAATSASTIGNSNLDDGMTAANTLTYLGAGGISTTGVNGGITGVEGTGAGTTPGTGVDILWPDSSAHCWKQNINNATGDCLIDKSTAATLTNKTFDTANNTFQNNGVAISGAGTPALYFVSGATVTWTTQPAALTEFIGATTLRQQFNFAPFTQFRLVIGVSTGGATTAALRVQYSTDSGSTWNYLETGGGTTHSIVYNTSGSPKVGSWVTLDAPARADVQVRIVGVNGDAAASPVFRLVSVQVR